MTSAVPWLEWGAIYHELQHEAQARTCWQHASTLPDGQVRGRLFLLASYEEGGALAQALTTADELLDKLSIERKARCKYWDEIFAAQGLTVNEDEIAALLQLDPELTDPAPLQIRRDTLAAQYAATPAPKAPTPAPETTPTPAPEAVTPPTAPTKPAPAKPAIPDFVNPPAEGG